VRDQFVFLIELQRLDDRLRALQAAQQYLPQRLQPYETARTEAQQSLARLQEHIAHTERQRRAFERELESAQVQLTKTQSKLHEIKTNKEYSAVLAEIAGGKQRITVLEDRILELMELLEQHRQAAQMQEQGVHEAGQALTEHHKHLQQDQEALAAQIMAEEEQRQRLVGNLDAPLYATYQRLAAQRGGHAVAQVQAGSCGGCHLKVQPQLVSDIRRQDKLVMCPHCRRMLLWPGE
jgi:predicted  nucleic acid-binding Zn-ribbon protein